MRMAQMSESILSDATFPKESAVTTYELGACETTEEAFRDLAEEHSRQNERAA